MQLLKPIVSLSLLIPIVWLSGCGAPPSSSTPRRVNSDAGKTSSGDGSAQLSYSDLAVEAPQGFYDQIFTSELTKMQLNPSVDDLSKVIWLNFNGGSVPKGTQVGESFLVCSSKADIAPSSIPLANQQQIADTVKKQLSAAGLPAIVTLDQPDFGDFTSIFVGGQYSDLGCGAKNIASVAPIDQFDANKNDIGFAFLTSAMKPDLSAATISRLLGHTMGLEYVNDPTNLMAKTLTPNASAFTKDIFANKAAHPTLPGLNQLSSMDQLLTQYDQVPSSIKDLLGRSLSPTSAQQLGGNTALLSVLTILSNPATQTNGQIDMSKLAGLLGSPQTQDLSKLIATLGLATGNPAAALLPVILPMISGQMQQQANLPSSNLDLAQLLNLSQVGSQAQLVSFIGNYSQILGGNFQGSNQQNLSDMLRLALSQRYSELSQ